MKKICFIASAGGHLDEIMKLESIMKKNNTFLVTEKKIYRENIQNEKTYYLEYVNRKKYGWILKMIKNIYLSIKIFVKEKPDITISTGVLSCIPMCIITKIFKKKLIFIESYAKVTSPTMTGRLIYRFADRFYVQWESMKKCYPHAIYKGALY